LIKSGGIFDLEAKDAHLSNLKDQISDPSLWDNNQKTTSLMKEISMCEKDINLRKSLSEKASDIN
jgi:peptide chain release factor 2